MRGEGHPTKVKEVGTHPRIIEKDSSLVKREDPGIRVTVSLPALMRSGSSKPLSGYGPWRKPGDSQPKRGNGARRHKRSHQAKNPVLGLEVHGNVRVDEVGS